MSAEGEYALRHEDFVMEMPQSGERIRGRDVVNIIELHDGRIFRETRYYADPFEAPAWREQCVERFNP